MPLGPSNTKITLKSPVTGLLFLFHLGNCLTTIGVAQISSPISIEFDACVVIPWGDLENQGYIQTRAKTIYMYADPVPGYKNGSYEGGYCPCHAWDMMGG
jgi:hypothetical protein